MYAAPQRNSCPPPSHAPQIPSCFKHLKTSSSTPKPSQHPGPIHAPPDDTAALTQTDETPIFIPSLGWTSFDPRGSVVLCAVFDPPRKLTAQQAATITLRDHAKLWTEYVVKAREFMSQADPSKGQDCPHNVKLKVLSQHVSSWCICGGGRGVSISRRGGGTLLCPANACAEMGRGGGEDIAAAWSSLMFVSMEEVV